MTRHMTAVALAFALVLAISRASRCQAACVDDRPFPWQCAGVCTPDCRCKGCEAHLCPGAVYLGTGDTCDWPTGYVMDRLCNEILCLTPTPTAPTPQPTPTPPTPATPPTPGYVYEPSGSTDGSGSASPLAKLTQEQRMALGGVLIVSPVLVYVAWRYLQGDPVQCDCCCGSEDPNRLFDRELSKQRSMSGSMITGPLRAAPGLAKGSAERESSVQAAKRGSFLSGGGSLGGGSFGGGSMASAPGGSFGGGSAMAFSSPFSSHGAGAPPLGLPPLPPNVPPPDFDDDGVYRPSASRQGSRHGSRTNSAYDDTFSSFQQSGGDRRISRPMLTGSSHDVEVFDQSTGVSQSFKANIAPPFQRQFFDV